MEAYSLLSREEGIIPALESSHALARAVQDARSAGAPQIFVVNLSGRGDKDMEQVMPLINLEVTG